jgi:hypothetical protein
MNNIYFKYNFKYDKMKCNEATVFVFYTLGAKPEYWKYEHLPEGWWWVGTGSTSPANCTRQLEYQTDEQFNGPKESLLEMKAYLSNYFETLEYQEVVSLFKIREEYDP